MGNRAVIVSKDTTKENQNKKLGIYLHWYGSEDTVKSFLQDAKEKGVRNVMSDPNYGWARLCQVISDTLTKDCMESEYEISKSHAYETGIGIGLVSTLDTHNYDNGVYYIDENWEIVKHTDGSELEESPEPEVERIDTWEDNEGKPVVSVFKINVTFNDVTTEYYGIFDLEENDFCCDSMYLDRDEAERQAEDYTNWKYKDSQD